MKVLFIGIILTMLDVAVALYQINHSPNAAAESPTDEARWTV